MDILRDIISGPRSTLIVGLTGGIGSGKSTAAALLQQRGAQVVDADTLVRELQASGGSLVPSLVEAFGAHVVGSDGAIDRKALAEVAFSSADDRQRLEAIVHPAVAQEAWKRLNEVPVGHIGVYDVPLLVENSMESLFDAVVVVEAPLDKRLDRLRERGLSEVEAHRRISHQASDEQRRAVASVVIDNSGSIDDLQEQIDGVWQWLQTHLHRVSED